MRKETAPSLLERMIESGEVEPKPSWRKKEADCRKIGSVFIKFLTVDEATILKQFFDVKDTQNQIDVLDTYWNDYETSEEKGDSTEYELKYLEYRKDRTTLEFELQSELVLLKKNSPNLLEDARKILSRLSITLQSYIDRIPVEIQSKKTDTVDVWSEE